MDKSQIIMLIVAGVAAVLLVIRIVTNRNNDEEKNSEQRIIRQKKATKQNVQIKEIPDDRSDKYSKVWLKKEKIEIPEEQTYSERYQNYYDDGDETTAMDVEWNRFEESDGDVTVKIKRNIFSVQLENLLDKTQIYRKPIQNELVIGRKGASDIFITADKTISSRHCKIVKEYDDSFYIEDCNSTNGTYINHLRIDEKTKICDGDILEIGQSQFRITIIQK